MVTPHESYPDLAKALGVDQVYFKREDLHPYGSHKGRSIPVMIDHYYALGSKQFAISSSGNAALAAALHVKKLNKEDITLDIFVGNNIDPHKLERLKNATADSKMIRILNKERPLQALTMAVQDGVTSLRQSNDDEALVGYEKLAEEIDGIQNVGAIFIGTSSGTTAQALANYFITHTKKPVAGQSKQVQVHIVQTSACHPISDAFAVCEKNEENSIAGAIIDKTALRKDALVSLIKKTGGSGWCASNEDIDGALSLVKTHTKLDISPNSALSVVGVMKTAYGDHPVSGTVVCVICGE